MSMSDISAIDQSYYLDSNVEIGKFTCLVPSALNYADACTNPRGPNDAILGVAQESVLPDVMADYSAGVYTLITGTVWPTGAIPASGLGRTIRLRHWGVSRLVAGLPISRGQEVNINDTQGRVKPVNEAPGTLVYIVGTALDAAWNAGDVIRVLVMPYRRKA
jgi:hypothetical protein